ncbi:ABC transporter substrate-binding protein [Geovibrio ferrireducens]|uniref:ABC transporter substrate-binding protein n=1 Tax=Geovibrio ferrireducens TaxID=46201 RepID=UPI00224762A6|nr:ABC transporter substrate-binding protein [Geovibrio ferrireducens]
MSFSQMTVKEIIDNHPETRDIFISNGFEQFKDDAKLNTLGKFLKLETALKNKKFDVDTFVALLEDKVNSNEAAADVTLKKTKTEGAVSMKGLLPCPVRLPILEKIDAYAESEGVSVTYKLEAASVGADWMNAEIRNAESTDSLADIYLSAGFELFFSRSFRDKLQADGSFRNLVETGINPRFTDLKLEDPRDILSIVSLVPAVFMLNLEEQGDLPEPKTWADLLRPEYENKVALPVGDFDLFNAILLNIYKEHGMEGVRKLGKCLIKSMHPAEMVKNAGKKVAGKPYITIMPYFFTKMLAGLKTVKVYFPEDGAIVSPVFMLARDKEGVRPLAQAVAGKAVGEILTQKGLFPSTHPDVQNVLPDYAPFKWIGWDFIENNDIDQVIEETMNVFKNS